MGRATPVKVAQGTIENEGHSTIKKSNMKAKHAGKHAFRTSIVITSDGGLSNSRTMGTMAGLDGTIWLIHCTFSTAWVNFIYRSNIKQK